jgi:hypothetical protein
MKGRAEHLLRSKGERMDEMNATKRDDPHSLAPIQIEGTSIDEDIAQLKRGKGARLIGTMLCLGLGAFGVMQWMERIDGTQAYAAAADKVEIIHAQQANVYLRCVLPNLQRSQLASQQALHTAFEIASDRFQKGYAKQLAHCAPSLDGLQAQLATLTVPADVESSAKLLRDAAVSVGEKSEAYRAYLQDRARPYDFVQATPHIEKIARAWSGYDEKRRDLVAALRSH